MSNRVADLNRDPSRRTPGGSALPVRGGSLDPNRQPVATVAMTGKRFGDVSVLGPIAFSVEKGETLAVTGPSGIGKSTLLRILAGLDTTFQGSCEVEGRVAMVFQEPTLLPWRSASENLKLAARISMADAEKALGDVGLAGLGGRFPGQLSLGQQRRLSLARAFACDPDLLLMDEAFVSLDADLAEDMHGLFEALRARNPVATVLVTHDQAEVARLATRVIRLEGIPAEIVDDRPVRRTVQNSLS